VGTIDRSLCNLIPCGPRSLARAFCFIKICRRPLTLRREFFFLELNIKFTSSCVYYLSHKEQGNKENTEDKIPLFSRAFDWAASLFYSLRSWVHISNQILSVILPSCFPNIVQRNIIVVKKIRPRTLPSISFRIHCLLTTLPLYSRHATLSWLTILLNKPLVNTSIQSPFSSRFPKYICTMCDSRLQSPCKWNFRCPEI